MGERTDAIRQDIQLTRERMGTTLDALGHKANIPARARDQYKEHRAPIIGGGAGLVVLIAGIVTLIVVLRRRDKD